MYRIDRLCAAKYLKRRINKCDMTAVEPGSGMIVSALQEDICWGEDVKLTRWGAPPFHRYIMTA